MKTIKDIRLEKGFATGKAFADEIGIPPSYYSAIAAGKKKITTGVIQLIESKFPNEDFSYLYEQSIKGVPVIEKSDTGSSLPRASLIRKVPIIPASDRHKLIEIELNGFKGTDSFYMPTQWFPSQRTNYFVVEALNEPYVTKIDAGDRLLCYPTVPAMWDKLTGFILIILVDGRDRIIKIQSNQLGIDQSGTITSDSAAPIEFKREDIQSIYKIESSIYRTL